MSKVKGNTKAKFITEKKKIITQTPDPQHVLVTQASLHTGILLRNKHLLNNVNNWHKFTVYSVGNAKSKDILTAILEHVHPLDLIPVASWIEDNCLNFLGRNCGPAIEKLCTGNLLVPNPNSNTPFMLCVMLKFATTAEFKIDVQKNVYNVLCTRYNAATKVLNLSKFHDDTALMEFTPLFQPKILYFVLGLSKNLFPPPEAFILSNNRIKLLNSLDPLSNLKHVIKYIDLRNNLIDSMDSLHHLKQLRLTELILDGNPVCSKYTPSQYVSHVTDILKDLAVLDGLPLKRGSFPVSRKNFLCNFDAKDTINQFLEYYFYIYDMPDRSTLKMAYHKDAMFTLTTAYIADQVSSAVTRLHTYNCLSRNIQKMANFSQSAKNVLSGNQKIICVLQSLPKTEHCRSSLLVDLMQYTDSSAIVTVSGVFKEVPENLLEQERQYGFRRTFVLSIKLNGLCVITNELVHIQNAFSWQMLNSFPRAKSPIRTIEFPKTDDDRKKAIDAFKLITTLNTEWSKRCLEDRQYNVKMALMMFVDLYKKDQIPVDGFKE